jgi:hypothetical protein
LVLSDGRRSGASESIRYQGRLNNILSHESTFFQLILNPLTKRDTVKLFIAIFLTFMMTGCSAIDVAEYRGSKPTFSFFDYFTGETKGWGIVQDRKGKVNRQFVVHITGEVDGETLTLFEQFTWRNGERTTRTWKIKKTGEHTFSGTAGDVVGNALGTTYGNVLNWKYPLIIETEGSTWKVSLDDWMFLLPDNVLLNKTEMSKFGIHLGDVTIAFRKPDKEEG